MEQSGFTDSVEMEIKDGSLVLSPRKVREGWAVRSYRRVDRERKLSYRY